MKRGNIFWVLLLVGTTVVFVVAGRVIANQHALTVPRKIVPAAAVLPPDRKFRDLRERDWLRVGLRVLQRRLDSLVADSARQLLSEP
jgi:hypothetical protein